MSNLFHSVPVQLIYKELLSCVGFLWPKYACSSQDYDVEGLFIGRPIHEV